MNVGRHIPLPLTSMPAMREIWMFSPILRDRAVTRSGSSRPRDRAGSQLARDVVAKRAEAVVAGDEIRLAIDLDQHAGSARRAECAGR